MSDSARGIAVGPQRRVKILNRGAFSWHGGKTTIWLDDKWHPVAHSVDLENLCVICDGHRCYVEWEQIYADESRNRSYNRT